MTGVWRRLSTEAKWEKAVRGTDGRRYPWGNEFDKNKCNADESGINDTTQVGMYSPQGDSPYGVSDMAGNVLEWCADWYAENYYKRSPLAGNPKGPNSGQYRVMRDGSWNHNADFARCAHRSRFEPIRRYSFVGFRVAESALPSGGSDF